MSVCIFQHHANRIASINSNHGWASMGKTTPFYELGAHISHDLRMAIYGKPLKKTLNFREITWKKIHIFSTLSTWYLLSNIFSLYNQFSQHFSWSNPLFCVGYPTVLDHVPGETIWFPHLWIHLNTGESQKKPNTLGQPWLGGLCSPFFCWGEKKWTITITKTCGLMWTTKDWLGIND